MLHRSFFNLKKAAAVGVDGVTWCEYERDLEANLKDLHGRIHRGSYRAKPSRRSWIPKPDGCKRPLGIASLEDKIVQAAVSEVLKQIYVEDFLGFSYGFRTGRNQHDALDALTVGITGKRMNWILDADIEGFFEMINHDWMVRFLEHRIGDCAASIKRVSPLRLRPVDKEVAQKSLPQRSDPASQPKRKEPLDMGEDATVRS